MKDDIKKRIVKWFWILFSVPFLLFLILFLLVWAFADIPSFEELEHPDSKLATQVIASGGEVLSTFHIENRSFVSFAELDSTLVQAAIATEDVRFRKHSGIDFKSLGRVAVKTLLLRDSSQGGGSTITQQLAKTLYPREEGGRFKIVVIKLKEWITAVKLERNYTKDEIITMYFNAIAFGSNSFGIKAASQTFFAKNPSELTVEESALLVGMINKPTRYNPAINPEHALNRRNFVISQMEKAGYITKHERDSLQLIPISLTYQVMDHNAGIAPYFRDMLRRVMNAKKPRKSSYQDEFDYKADSLRWADDSLYGWLNKKVKPDGSRYDLDKDGLRIYTTINYKMQKYAEEAVAEHLGKDLQNSFWSDLKSKRNAPFSNDIDKDTRDRVMKHARRVSDRWRMMKKRGCSESEILKSFSVPVSMRVFDWNEKGYSKVVEMTPDDSIMYYKSHLRAAFMAIEPNTGFVKAYVGGPNYRYFKYDNLSQAKRQVGSTIKPFLYSIAMEDGLRPCEQVVNLPQTFLVSKTGTWTPRSTDKEEWIGRTVTLKWGITVSSNNISAYLMKQYGPEAMVAMMRRMGIKARLDPVPALCVGPADISVCEMVAAYNTFPSGGVFIEPLFVTRIEDSTGNVISEFVPRKSEAIGANTAYLMIDMMQGVVNGGTASRLRNKYHLTGQIAGKTGTTNDNSDGWFIGYTPTLTAGGWVGAEDRQIHFQSGALGAGANMSLPIWGLFMKKVLADGTLGVSASDVFAAPADYSGYGCAGGETVSEDGGDLTEESLFYD